MMTRFALMISSGYVCVCDFRLNIYIIYNVAKS